MISRRHFVQLSMLAAGGTLVGCGSGTGGGILLRPHPASNTSSQQFLVSPPLRKFVQALPTLGPQGMQVASPDTSTYSGVDYYRLALDEFRHSFHPDFSDSRARSYIRGFSGSRVWGYRDEKGLSSYLGGSIVAKSGRPVRISYRNNLPSTHPIPVDTSLDGAEIGMPQNRTVAHLHGGFVPWTSDGGPHGWSAPNGMKGQSYVNWLPDKNGTKTADNYYPNQQSSRLLWFHDHAMGITRINVYAGLAAAYVLRDDYEQTLIDKHAIPGAIAGTEIPLIIQDKTFIAPNTYLDDMIGDPGDLWYPRYYDPALWDLTPTGKTPPKTSCVPEFFGDTMLVNGAAYPYIDVQPRKYRLRLLNGCNARFCNLQLFYAKSSNFPDSTEADLTKPGPTFLQIGNECGFLPQSVGPVQLSSILMAPAERADVIVDFSGIPSGSVLILYSDAAAPFPMGDSGNEYYPGNSANATPVEPGFSPNTRTILQFRIGALTGGADPAPQMPLILPPMAPISTAGAVVRNLTLNEDSDDYGRLRQTLGTNQAMSGMMSYGRNFMDTATETPNAGDVEIWNIANLTGDTHPIHFHLVNVQVLGRTPFDAEAYDGDPSFTGTTTGPDANESGWKETVRMNPEEVTQVIMKVDLPSSPVPVPVSPRTGGHEYVWHCHILEHEEHDMMRPLIVK